MPKIGRVPTMYIPISELLSACVEALAVSSKYLSNTLVFLHLPTDDAYTDIDALAGRVEVCRDVITP